MEFPQDNSVTPLTLPMDSRLRIIPPYTYRCRGKEIDLTDNIRAYLVSTASLAPPTMGIVIVHDIFGFDVNSIRRFADMLSDQSNAHVLLPDFLRGKQPWSLKDYPPKRFSTLTNWVKTNCSWEDVSSVLSVANNYLRTQLSEENQKKLGILGISWGGRHVLRACSSRNYGYLAGVSVDGYMLETEDAHNLSIPVFFMPSGDNVFNEPIKKILDRRPFGDRCRYYTFAEETQGFASALGDLNNQSTLEAVNQTIMLASAFFIENLREEEEEEEENEDAEMSDKSDGSSSEGDEFQDH